MLVPCERIQKFSKVGFDLDNILTTANELKYTGAIKRYFNKQFESPSTNFVRFCVSKVYTGRITQNVLEQFSGVVRKALKQFVREKVKNRLQSALEVEQDEAKEDEDANDMLGEGVVEVQEGGIVTTQEEVYALQIIKAIGCKNVDVNRITMRDKVSYCGILLDDNNRKPICRLHFNTQQKRLGLFKNKEEEKVEIDRIEDIYQYSDRIEETIKEYFE